MIILNELIDIVTETEDLLIGVPWKINRNRSGNGHWIERSEFGNLEPDQLYLIGTIRNHNFRGGPIVTTHYNKAVETIHISPEYWTNRRINAEVLLKQSDQAKEPENLDLEIDMDTDDLGQSPN